MALKNSVTMEEYEASLRNTVNAYYIHAVNDLAMSREEAVSSTAHMAENYYNAVNEFQAHQNMQSEMDNSVNDGLDTKDMETDNTEIDTEGMEADNAETDVEDMETDNENIDAEDGLDGEGCDDGMDI